MSTIAWHNDRIRGELGRKISWVIAHRLNDPRVPSVVTVTDIKLAPDTRNATVYISVFGDDKAIKGALIALNRAAPYVQRIVSDSMSIRHFPRLYFKLDSSLEYSHHINELLEQVKDDLEQA
jgi:ribosome-binding factor A